MEQNQSFLLQFYHSTRLKKTNSVRQTSFDLLLLISLRDLEIIDMAKIYSKCYHL